MKACFAALLLPLCISAQVITLPETFTTTKGQSIRNAKITGTPEGAIKIMHDGGIATLPHNQLPSEVLSLLGITAAPPEEPKIMLPDPLVTQLGISYVTPVLTEVDPDGIRISHSNGRAKVRYEELPATVLEVVGPFDPKLAASFRDQEEERNRTAYKNARDAIMEAQNAGNAAAAADQAAMEAQLKEFQDDPNKLSSVISVEIKASSTGGKNNETNWQTWWGSSSKSTTSERTMRCTIQSKSGSPQRMRMQCLLLSRDIGGGKNLHADVVADGNVSLAAGAVKTVVASSGTESTQENYVLIGLRIVSGEKYVGWSWRAIDAQGRIAAVRSSTPAYDRFAWSTPL